MRSMGQEVPVQKRALELNPKHPLVENLRTAHAAHPDDAGIAETASLLHDMAVLAEGGGALGALGLRREARAAPGGHPVTWASDTTEAR